MDNLKRNRNILNSMSGGKMPPSETELEEAVLGAMLLEKEAYDVVAEILLPETFYKEQNSVIFKAIKDIKDSNQPIDILTVTAELKKQGKLDVAGGAFYIVQLTNRVASAANIEYHARLIAEAYLGREIIRLGSEMSTRAFNNDEDVFELIDDIYSQIDNIKNFGADSGSDIPFKVLLRERVALKEQLVRDGVSFTGIPTGNKYLDSITGGWVNGNSIIIAARPAMGKSVKGLQYAKICATMAKKPAAIFSLEMSADELIDRYIVEEAKVYLQDYRANKMTPYDLEKVRNAKRELEKLPIHIYDKAAIGISYIKRKCKQIIKKEGDLGLIVIDYLQLMSSSLGKVTNREQEIANISRGIKGLAKELNVPIISLAQVGRIAEKSSDKRPTLDSLRESGSIENDADIVLFIYRPEYYFEWGKHPDSKYSQDSMTETDYKLAAELIVAKNRNGTPNVVINEKFYGYYSMFTDAKEDTLAEQISGMEYDEPLDSPF
jgi:replicative DNA helicase